MRKERASSFPPHGQMTNFLNCADYMCIPCADCHLLYGESFIFSDTDTISILNFGKGMYLVPPLFFFFFGGGRKEKAFWMRTEVYYYISVDWSSRTH